MPDKKDEQQTPLDKPADTVGEFASPPCYQHELDPDYQGFQGSEPVAETNPSTDVPSTWETVRPWRIHTRAYLNALREALTEQKIRQYGNAIISHLESADFIPSHSQIGFYWPMEGEIDLRPLLSELIKSGCQAALPVITKPKQALEFWRWRPDDALSHSGLWGIPAPVKRDPVAVTVLLIPLLGFDDQGHRLGHGGGYYDRTLAQLNPRPKTVGIGIESCRLPTIFPQAHDIALDVIVTEAGVYKTGSTPPD